MTRPARVVVIGGGIAGASAAWALAAELDVTLVEMEAQAGRHATGRSAAVLSETSGPEVVCALAAASRSFYVDPPIGDGPLVSPRGLLWVADGRAAEGVAALEATARAVGADVERLDAAGVCELVEVMRGDRVEAGLLEPGTVSIDVARTLEGFLGGLRARGGRVMLATPALRIVERSPGWTVHCRDATIECDVVVDAAGAWADEVARRAGVAPVGLRPLQRTAFTFPVEGAGGWPLVMDVGQRFYFEPEGPGVLASPCDETPVEPHDAVADELAVAMAVDALAEATTLEVRGVRSRWAGLRTFAGDRVPVVGEDPDHPGFYWLAGQGGAGIKTAPALAEIIAVLVLDDTPASDRVPLEAISPERFR
jgi:D-arginine dehydrogenase